MILIGLPICIFLMTESITGVRRAILNFEILCIATLLSFDVFRLRFSLILIGLYLCSISVQITELISIRFDLPLLDIYEMVILSFTAMPKVAQQGAIFFAVFGILSYLIVRFVRYRIYTARNLFLGMVMLPVGFDIFLGPNILIAKDVVDFPNIMSSPIAKYALRYYNDKSLDHIEFWSPAPLSHTLLRQSINDNDFVLFIEFESLGELLNHRERARLNEMIANAFPGYVLDKRFSEPFAGGTLSGELRTLCGIKNYSGSYRSPNINSVDFSVCLPKSVENDQKKRLYSIAAHGNHGTFYSRIRLYPKIGFDESIFAENLNKDLGRRCKNFQFVSCDEVVLEKLFNVIKDLTGVKIFAHMMTINSHFPYSGDNIGGAKKSDPLELYFAAIETTILALKQNIGTCQRCPDAIIVSGDHAPPFSNEIHRNEFLPDLIPVFVFKRR